MRYFVIRGFGVKRDGSGNEFDFERTDRELIAPALALCAFEGGTTGEIPDSGSIHDDRYRLPCSCERPADAVPALVAAIRRSATSERETDSPIFRALRDLPEAPSDAAVLNDFAQEVQRAKVARDRGWLLMLADELRARACKRQLLDSWQAYRASFRRDLNSFYCGIACLQVGHMLLSLSGERRWKAMFRSPREAARQRGELHDELRTLRHVVATAIEPIDSRQLLAASD